MSTASPATATGRAVPVRVELPAGRGAVVHLPGVPDIPVDAETLAALLAVGLHLAPRASHEALGEGTLEVDDATRFYIAATLLPIGLALDAVARGVAAAVRAVAQKLPPAEHLEDQGPAPTSSRDPLRGFTHVPVTVAETTFERLLDRVTAGERLVLTREDEAVAAVVPWGQYADLRERAARFETSYWAAQSETAKGADA